MCQARLINTWKLLCESDYLTNLQIVNTHLVFEPVNIRNMPLLKPANILFCHTEMGEHIKVSGSKKSFKMKKSWRGDNNNGGDDEKLHNPEV